MGVPHSAQEGEQAGRPRGLLGAAVLTVRRRGREIRRWAGRGFPDLSFKADDPGLTRHQRGITDPQTTRRVGVGPGERLREGRVGEPCGVQEDLERAGGPGTLRT